MLVIIAKKQSISSKKEQQQPELTEAVMAMWATMVTVAKTEN